MSAWQNYSEAREAFLGSTEPVIVKKERLGNGEVLGWTISRGRVFQRARGGVRVFKTLDGVEAFCKELGVTSFEVVEI